MEMKVITAFGCYNFELRLNELAAKGWRCISHTRLVNPDDAIFDVYSAVLERPLELKKG